MDSAVGREVAEPEFAQRKAEMFERNIAHIASREKEIICRTHSGEEYRGFVSGLDEYYLQVCKVDTQTLALVDRESLVAVEETGRRLHRMERNDDLDADSVRKIREQTRHYTVKMRERLQADRRS